jgi:cytochrome b subunit of formate dehydrogenase
MNDGHRMVKMLSQFQLFLWRGVLIYIPLCLDSTRTVRSVEYRDPEDVWKYTGGGKRLPSASHYNHSTYMQLITIIIICTSLFLFFLNGAVQWSAWMTHTRLHPPTIEVLLFFHFPSRRS